MECGCLIDNNDCYEPAVIFHSNIRQARKQYRCDECRNEITAGKRYEYLTMAYRNYDWIGYARHFTEWLVWDHYRICIGCRNLGLDLYCNSRMIGNLADDVREHLGVCIVSGDVDPWEEVADE
jgi:hypothetical protein